MLRSGRSHAGFLDDVRKYVDYVFDARSFAPAFDAGAVSDGALRAAETIRGSEHQPAIIIHGIMPRSGTVYVGELLRLHPDLYAYPNHVWEMPLLQLADDVRALQAKFLWAYRHNAGKLGDGDFLPLVGSAFLAYLSTFTPERKRMLLKVPGVHRLDDFYTMFPREHLLVLVRDGRDVVHSTLKTWPQLRFSFVCRRWRRSAEMVLACHQRYSQRGDGYWLARFEDAVRDPAAFVREACRRFGLDEGSYSFEEIRTIPVRGSSSNHEKGKVVWNPVDKPQGFKPVGRWQAWPTRKKRTFKRIAGQALMKLGYCEDLNW
jgi:protein-tyrosine sulfotransferase